MQKRFSSFVLFIFFFCGYTFSTAVYGIVNFTGEKDLADGFCFFAEGANIETIGEQIPDFEVSFLVPNTTQIDTTVYMADCGSSEVDIIPTAQYPSTEIWYQGGVVSKITLPIARAGIYPVPIVIKSRGAEKSKTLVIKRGFEADTVVRQYWNDVLAINKNPKNNGGYTFTKTEWTHTENNVVSAVRSGDYLYFGSSKLPREFFYNALLTIDDTITLPLCKDVQLKQLSSAGVLSIYPNPMRTAVTLENPFWEESHRIELFDANGTLQQVIPSAGEKTNINVQDLLPGVYVVRIGKETLKILVEK
ncbi:hypothetical protein FACS1894199_05940 [Bacteroidia bacterium]|nr:hypothetical protein FACS1894199_05940 [Bacteroidia bacterium]